MKHTFFNPDGPAMVNADAPPRVNPDAPSMMTQEERDGYTIPVSVACKREFDFTQVDPRIKQEKPWGKRNWDEGAPTAISFQIPLNAKQEILAKLRGHPDVIFAEGPLEIMERFQKNTAAMQRRP